METTEFVYNFNITDYVVIGAFVAMLMSIGFIMKKFCSNTHDYFVGGNKVAWWLAGASAFMAGFSAWTFTGAAGFAYQHGILIMTLFHFNALAYFLVGLFLADKCRQTRKMTYLQIIYDRFGRISEQFFTWIQIPIMLLGGAIWLTGLSTFVSVAFGLPMSYTIVMSGVIILLYCTLAGSWGVVTSDFLQSIILMSLTIVVAVLTIIKGGGVGNLMSNIDPEKLKFVTEAHPILWICAYFLMTTTTFSSITGATRYFSVRDGKNAKKAAFLTASLFVVGPMVWFIPPIAASYFFPDIAATLPAFTHPQDGAYVLMALTVLPHGLAGLLIMVIFSATLSSMGGAVNQNAAIVCMNIYKPLIRPNAGHKEMFLVAHIATLIVGICMIFLSLVFAKQTELPLFDLMLILSSAIGLPMAFPFLLVYWVKKTPPFSAMASVIASSTFSILSKNFGFLDGPHRWATEIINSTGLFVLDPSVQWPLPFLVGGIIIIGGGIFMLSTLAWSKTPQADKDRIAQLYVKMNTPIDYEKENIPDEDNRQFFIVGIMAMVIGAGIMIIALTPNTATDRFGILFTGGFVVVVGYALYKAGLRFVKQHKYQAH